MASEAEVTRTQTEKRQHAASERKRYRTLKNGLIRAIADANGMGTPCCMMPVSQSGTCRVWSDLEIDHAHFSKFKQRKMNLVQRLERFAIEFIKWQGGDDKCELRLACRSCNARHQPRRK